MTSTLSKDKVFWTKSMNIDLAKFMKDKPFIWDPRHPQYSNLAARDEAFAEFGSRYNEDISWQAVKDRWTNIRSSYSFYMRKIIARKAKGQNFQVNWFLWKPCQYLYDVYKLADSYKKHKKTKTKVESDASNQQDTSGDESQSAEFDNTPNVTCEDIVNNIATVFKGAQNGAFDVDKSKYAEIGQAVTKKLSELNSYDAAQLSTKIMEILEEYDENNPTNPNNMWT